MPWKEVAGIITTEILEQKKKMSQKNRYVDNMQIDWHRADNINKVLTLVIEMYTFVMIRTPVPRRTMPSIVEWFNIVQ